MVNGRKTKKGNQQAMKTPMMTPRTFVGLCSRENLVHVRVRRSRVKRWRNGRSDDDDWLRRRQFVETATTDGDRLYLPRWILKVIISGVSIWVTWTCSIVVWWRAFADRQNKARLIDLFNDCFFNVTCCSFIALSECRHLTSSRYQYSTVDENHDQ